jgi:hypothetical protein
MCTLLSGFAFPYSSGIRYSVKFIYVWYRFSSLTISGQPSEFDFRSADLISASAVTMSTVVPTKVSPAEMKLQAKVTEQRERELAKMLESRVRDAQKVVNKIAATKLGLATLVSRADLATLPDMVRLKLLHLFQTLQGIHDSCTNIVETSGGDEGDIITLQDTIHT